MKKTILLAVLVIAAAGNAQAKQLTAEITCSCANWVYSPSGEMKLVKANMGTSTYPKLSESFTNDLLTQRWSQKEETMSGYASVTPFFFESSELTESGFVDGSKDLKYIIDKCENVYAKLSGNVACGVTITFPINENARSKIQN